MSMENVLTALDVGIIPEDELVYASDGT